MRRAYVLRFVRRVLLVVLASAVGLAVEDAMLALLLPNEVRRVHLAADATTVAPLFLAGMVPVGAAVTLLFVLVERGHRRVLAALGLAGAIALGWSLTGGRHFASWAVRAPTLVGFGVVGALGAMVLPTAIRSRAGRASLGLVVAACWALDAFAMRRTLAPLHWALFICSIGACGFVVLLHERRLGRAWLVGLVLAVAALAWAPLSARAVRHDDSLQVVLVERAPWSGRAVRLATLVANAPREQEAEAPPPHLPTLEPDERALDWGHRDVLLITIDTLRADHLGAYGYARPTSPHLDALAMGGALFLHAYSPMPHTSYALVSLLTGRRIRPVLEGGDGGDVTTLALELRTAGYTTAAFYPPAVFYVDTDRFRSFQARGLDFEERTEEFADPATRARQLEAWLAGASSSPVFAWVHIFEPHEPYERHPSHDFGESDVDAYDSEVADADEGVGALVSAMRAARPNAVIIVSADHGEEFEDHGGHFHGATAYEEQVRVPLVVFGPGVPPSRIEQPVQLVDVLPTILAAVGQRRPPGVEGRDLGLLVSGRVVDDDSGASYAEADAYEMAARGSLRLVCARETGACELFDLAGDPREEHGVGRERPGDVRAMRTFMAALKTRR